MIIIISAIVLSPLAAAVAVAVSEGVAWRKLKDEAGIE